MRPRVTVPHCALRARVWMLYEERRVDGGRDRYDESKQSVTLVRDAEDKQDVEIVSAGRGVSGGVVNKALRKL